MARVVYYEILLQQFNRESTNTLIVSDKTKKMAAGRGTFVTNMYPATGFVHNNPPPIPKLL